MSEQTSAQAELPRANAREIEILESIVDEVIALDHDWNVIFVNSNAVKNLGKAREDMLGKSYWDVWPQYVGTITEEQTNRAMRDRVPVQFEVFSPVSYRWIEIRACPTTLGLTLYYRDVSDRKKTELLVARQNCVLKMLNASNQALLKITEEQALLDEVCRIAVEVGQFRLAWVGFPIQDAAKSLRCVSRHGLDDGYIEQVSLTWADRGMGGFPAGAAITSGEPVVENDLYSHPLVPQAAIDRQFKALLVLPLVTAGETFGVLCVYGGEKDAFDPWEIGNLKDLAGDLAHGIMAIRALADLKRSEEDRRQIEAQLRNSQKLEAIGTLAGGIAHDFNNILGTILGNVELAFQDTAGTPTARQSLDQIRSAAHRGRDLTQQILLFGRRHQTSLAVTNLAPIIDQAKGLLRSTTPHRIEIACSVHVDTPPIQCDRSQLLQLLVNLGSNAAQAIESGPGRIEISALGVESNGNGVAGLAPGKYAQISIRDTGVGMDEATMKRIFEPFFTTKKVGEGTGLGLSVVHGIVRSHGAEIVVRSGPNAGTTFDVYFPAATTEAPLPATESPESDFANLHGKRILIIDDDEALVFLCMRMLTRKGCISAGYTDAVEAVEVIRQNPDGFDAVLTDYNMPLMSGLEVAKAIRKINPKLPVALTSGYVTDELRSMCQAAGINEIVYKPNAVEESFEAIARLLDTHPEKRQTPTPS